MGEKFNRALWGYKPNEVHDEINHMEIEFENSLKELEEKLAGLRAEAESRSKQIAALQAEIASSKKIKDEIGDNLFKTYISATEMVLNTIDKAQQQQDDINNVLNLNEHEKKTLKESYQSLVYNLRQEMKECKAKFGNSTADGG